MPGVGGLDATRNPDRRQASVEEEEIMEVTTKCYLVHVNTTNALKSTYQTNAITDIRQRFSEYMSVIDGVIYVVAENATKVATNFPDALEIKEVGLGISLCEDKS